MAENEDNIIRTRLEIEDESYRGNLQTQYVQPSEQAAAKVAEAFEKTGERLVNAGKNSLDRMRTELNKPIQPPKIEPPPPPPPPPNFAENYQRAFDDITKRADLARSSMQKFIQVKADKGQFDLMTQSAIAAEKNIGIVQNGIKQLRIEAAKPENQGFIKELTNGVRILEIELDKLERKARAVRQGGGTGGATGGGGIPPQIPNSGGIPPIPSGGAGRNGFGNLYLASQLANSIPGVGSIAGGAVVAGPAGAAVAATIEAINAGKELVSVGKDLSKQAIEEAASFEQTTKALAVFTGGVGAAKAELSEIDQIARDTPGLKLLSAEEGYQRLRALGFQADVVGKLVKGIGVQRVISGADEAAVGRVITNLQQIQATPENASRDIKEIIKAIPSLTGVFKEAFGTADFNKLDDILKKDPDAFFKKFADGLANSKGAQAGLNITIEKGYDAVTELGRAFGEPFLDPFTEDVKGLTGFLNENQTAVREWGQEFADTAQGVILILDAIKGTKGQGTLNVLGAGLRGALAGATFGGSELVIGGLKYVSGLGEAERRKKQEAIDAERRARVAANGGELPDQRVVKDAAGNLTFYDKTPEESAKDAENAQRKVQEARENQQRAEDKLQDDRLKAIARRRDIDAQDIQAHLEYAKALNGLQTGKVNPVDLIRQNAALEETALRNQIAVRNNATKEAIRNISGRGEKDTQKFLELQQDNNVETGKLNDQIALVRVNARKAEIDEIKRQAEAVHNLRNEVRDFLVSSTEAARDNNPFLKIFTEAESVVDRFEQRFKLFGVTFAREMAKIELSRLEGEAAQVRYQSSTRSLSFAQQARRLANEPENQRGEFQFRLSRVQTEAEYVATQATRIREARNANYYARIFNPNNPLSADEYFSRRSFGQANDSFVNNSGNILEDIAKLRGVGTANTGIYGQGAIAEQILKAIPEALVPSLIKNAGGFGSTGENARNLLKERADALQKTKELGEQKFKDFVANQEFIQTGRKDAEERLKNLQDAKGLTDRQRNQEFLNITAEIGSENLSPALRRGRVEALNQASRFEKENEKQIRDNLKDVADVVKKFDDIISKKGLKMDFDAPILNMSVEKGLSVTQNKKPPATPTAHDTAEYMGLEVQFTDNQFQKRKSS